MTITVTRNGSPGLPASLKLPSLAAISTGANRAQVALVETPAGKSVSTATPQPQHGSLKSASGA
ncbi:MAG: hypothetical protein ACOVPA_16560 [Rubrivivax sp.]